MEDSERIRREVHAAAARLDRASAEVARLSRRKEFEAELRTRGNWLANGPAPMPDWVKPWHDYFESLPTNPEYQRWTEEARLASEALDTDSMVDRLRAGDDEAVEWGVAYLEADPWAFRTGYTKAAVSRRLRQESLSVEQRERLRAAILNLVQKGPRFDFNETRRLARRLDTPKFRRQVESFLKHPDAGTRQRAQLLLESCDLNDTRGD